jgi:alpha-tubulin suppressor-like RCC1 family protein
VFSWGAGDCQCRPQPPYTRQWPPLILCAGEYGKLGLGDEEKHTSPVLVEELQGKGVRAVACGGFHSVALSDTGSVYCWGGGDKGQLGLGNDKSQTLPCVVDALQVLSPHENNTELPQYIAPALTLLPRRTKP